MKTYTITLWEESSKVYTIETDQPLTEERFWELRERLDGKEVWGDYSLEIEEVSE